MRVIFSPLLQPHWPQVIEHLPLALAQDTRGVVALDADSGRVLGAVVCEDWTHTSVQCHIVIMHRAALRAGLHIEAARYVFTDGARLKMYGLVPANNAKALKLNRHLGFREIVRLQDAYDHGVDYVVMELRREDCPYWKQRPEDLAEAV